MASTREIPLTFYLLSVCGTSVVGVDLFARRALVEAYKTVQQVIAGRIVIISSTELNVRKTATP